MIKQFLKEGSIYTISNIATKGISLLLIPFYTSHFAPSDYGTLDFLSIFTGFLIAIVSLQIGQSTARYIGDPNLDELQKKKMGSTALNSLLLIYALVMLVFLLTASFWTNMVPQTHVANQLFRLAIVNTFVMGIFYQLGIQMRYKRKTRTFAILSFTQTIGEIILIFCFVAYAEMGIESIFIAAMCIAPIVIAIQFYALKSDYLFYIGKVELKKILAFSVPLIPATLSLLLLGITDRFFISQYISIDQLGIYSLGAKFPAVLTLLISGFAMALSPIVMEGYQLESTKDKLNKLLVAYLFFGGILVLIIALFSSETLLLLASENYFSASKIMPVLYLVAFLNGISMFNVGLFLHNKTKLIALITVFCALINIVLNIYLVSYFGILGAAFAGLISILLNTMLGFYFGSRYYWYISFKYVFVALAILVVGIILVTVFDSLHMQYRQALMLKGIVTAVLLLTAGIGSKRLFSDGKQNNKLISRE